MEIKEEARERVPPGEGFYGSFLMACFEAAPPAPSAEEDNAPAP
jgi:hypothetical protein